MNRKYSIVTMAALLIALSGCGREDQNPAPTSQAVAPAESVGAKVERQLDKAGEVLDDASITAKVKTALIAAPDLKALQINVDTVFNVVTLTGTVASEGLRQQAETTAKAVEGVREVKNNLTVG